MDPVDLEHAVEDKGLWQFRRAPRMRKHSPSLPPLTLLTAAASSVLPILLAGSLAAQTPSFTTFGNPCTALPGSLPQGVPLTNLNLPRIGQVFQLQMLSSGRSGPSFWGGVSSILAMGFSRTSFASIPLPWTPAIIQTFGTTSCGNLSVSAESLSIDTTYTVPQHAITVSFPIPANPGLVGTSVFFQAAALSASSPTNGPTMIVMGTAGEALIGI
jgi:hypothetical protein